MNTTADMIANDLGSSILDDMSKLKEDVKGLKEELNLVRYNATNDQNNTASLSCSLL